MYTFSKKKITCKGNLSWIWLHFFRNINYMKRNTFSKKRTTYKGNLIWILIHVFLSLNIFSLSPFFVQWAKKSGEEYNKNAYLSEIGGLNYQDSLIVDLMEEKQLNSITNLVRRELNQLKLAQYTRKTYKDIIDGQLSIISHEVRAGENLWTIARKYGVNVGAVISCNNLSRRAIIDVGQRLKIPSKKGILHRVKRRESLWDISKAYNLPIKTIREANYISNGSTIRAGEAIFIPGANCLPGADYKYYKNDQRELRSKLRSFIKDFIIRPISGRVTSGFGNRRHPIFGRMMFHSGIDISAPCGERIKAAMSGKVVCSGWSINYGRLVTIEHENGYTTKYAHNSKNLVSVGEYVEKGQDIALVGRSGLTTGPHVHFEILKNGIPQNPLKYLGH
ncbi:MAG: M23 family metallopeptidase [bacterium]|nr:M23 family metallopeptidase [bacterium]